MAMVDLLEQLNFIPGKPLSNSRPNSDLFDADCFFGVDPFPLEYNTVSPFPSYFVLIVLIVPYYFAIGIGMEVPVHCVLAKNI